MRHFLLRIFPLLLVATVVQGNDWISVVSNKEKYDGRQVGIDGFITLNAERVGDAILWFDKAAAEFEMHGYFVIDGDSLKRAIGNGKVGGGVKTVRDLDQKRVYIIATYHEKAGEMGISNGHLVVHSMGLRGKRSEAPTRPTRAK